MNEIHKGKSTGTLVEEQPAENVLLVKEKEKSIAGGPLKVRNFNLLFGGQTISVLAMEYAGGWLAL